MAGFPPQTSHRARVGAIGLAIVVLLIVLASAILGSASRERPVSAPGAAKPDIVANMALANEASAATDMAISPGPQNGAASAR